MDDFIYIVLFAITIFVCSLVQIVLKRNADKDYKGLRVYLNAPVLFSNVVFVGATFINVILMRYIRLSTAALLNSLTYVFIPVLSALFLKEKVTKRMVCGFVLIASGLCIYAIWG